MSTNPWPVAAPVAQPQSAPAAVAPVVNLPADASVKSVTQHYHGGHPKNKMPVSTFRIIRGQYARREFKPGDVDGTFVHYAAKSDDHPELPDTLAMTEREADRFGRAFLVEVSKGGIEIATSAQRTYIEDQAKHKVKKKQGA